MTVNEAITKLRVMLSGETEEVVATPSTEEVTMSESTLVDGTVVYTEGELAVGATLYVKTEEAEDPFAPSALHETTDGMLITVGENGEITALEEKATEAPVAEAAPSEEAMEEEVKKEETPAEFDAEGLLAAIADLIKQYQSEVSTEVEELKERFSAIADQPATKPIRNNFTKEAADAQTKAEARLANLIAIRKGKK